MRLQLRTLALTLACAVVPQGAVAQAADGSAIILPLEAQTCRLPNAPARIPEDADLKTLAEGKGRITEFQQALVDYRECLDQSRKEGITLGNRIALDRAHDYSVDLETRVAEQFNVAVRAYKARQQTD
ncbi:MAG: hypothetical protein R3348_05210 [Xanthomonadales bacterium]|nr:hypothetical protein [Xanthomonadales bacterium]